MLQVFQAPEGRTVPVSRGPEEQAVQVFREPEGQAVQVFRGLQEQAVQVFREPEERALPRPPDGKDVGCGQYDFHRLHRFLPHQPVQAAPELPVL